MELKWEYLKNEVYIGSLWETWWVHRSFKNEDDLTPRGLTLSCRNKLTNNRNPPAFDSSPAPNTSPKRASPRLSMSEAPTVPFYVKAMAAVGRVAKHVTAEPWPAPKRDNRNPAMTGEQDDGLKAVVEAEGIKGGGQRALLASRPTGDIKESDFKIVEEECPELGPGEVLIKNIYISLDPTHRLWASDQPQYMACVGINNCMRASIVGKVMKSNSRKWKEGTICGGMGGVQEYFVAKEAAIYPVIPGVPLPLNLSLFNVVIGLTAWVGVNICEPKAGQTIVVSGAAGAVGSVAAQLAKARGMKVVGLAGSESKCTWLKDELKLDGVINYKTEELEAGLARCCPEGVDAYFDNVGGKTLETMLTKMNRFGRIAYCGHISGYNSESAAVSVNQFQMILMRRLKIQGFICVDHMDEMVKCFAELLDLYVRGKMKVQEDIQETKVSNYVQCVNMLYTGRNTGKLMMKVSEEWGLDEGEWGMNPLCRHGVLSCSIYPGRRPSARPLLQYPQQHSALRYRFLQKVSQLLESLFASWNFNCYCQLLRLLHGHTCRNRPKATVEHHAQGAALSCLIVDSCAERKERVWKGHSSVELHFYNFDISHFNWADTTAGWHRISRSTTPSAMVFSGSAVQFLLKKCNATCCLVLAHAANIQLLLSQEMLSIRLAFSTNRL